MNYTLFDRHQVFTSDWVDYHSITIREVEDFFLDLDESPFNALTNMLNGIWDGYLYNELLETSNQMGLHLHLINRIELTIMYIKGY